MGEENKRCPVCGRRGFATHQALAGHLSRHSTAAHQLTTDDRRRGAQAALELDVPDKCPHCSRRRFRSRSAYFSHIGLHGLARKLGTDLRGAACALAEMGFYTTDPMRDVNFASQKGLRHLVSLGKVF